MVFDTRKKWSELFWSLADESKTEYTAIKRTEVFEFFMILQIHEETQAKKLKQLEKNGKS